METRHSHWVEQQVGNRFATCLTEFVESAGWPRQAKAQRRILWRFTLASGLGIVFVLGLSVTERLARADDTTKSKAAVTKAKKADGKKGAEAAAMDEAAKTDKGAGDTSKSDDDGDTKRPPKVVKTNAEWKTILPSLSFRVARMKETEQPFQNKYWDNKRHGKYLCVCCGEELYRSDEKFDSGTGWPSFWAPVSERAIATEVDYANNNVRTEVHCDRCGAHLGHIFDDGPQPTGMRHCINSASLKFVAADASKSK